MAKGHYKQNALNLEFRIRVIEDSEKGLSQRKIAQKYKCGKTQIQKILRNKDVVKSKWLTSVNKNVKRTPFQPYEEVNKLTLAWFQNAHSIGLPTSGPILQHKAKEFAKKLGKDSFTGSNGWLRSFCIRNNIVFRPLSGERASVKDILKKYCSKDIYGAQEINLFFRAITEEFSSTKESERIVEAELKNQSASTVREKEDLITIMLCANALGEKEIPLLVHKCSQLKCDKSIDMCVQWYTDEKALMTQNIFNDFLSKFNDKMKSENRTVAMLVDNAPYHLYDVDLPNLKLVYISPNNNLQPLDHGITNTFKLHYRKRLLSALAARIDEAADIYELARSVDMSDAARWISQAWECIQPQTIIKRFDTCRMDAIVNSGATDHETKQIQNDLHDLRRQINIEVDKDIAEIETTSDDNPENLEEVRDANETIDSIKTEPSCIKSIEINVEENDPLLDCLKSINELKNVAVKLDNNKLVQLLSDARSEFEKEILSKNNATIKKETQVD